MMEVCIDSIESAVAAARGGACRVELCSNLPEGGTTPSSGMLKVIKSKIQIPVMVMIRPRGGDFLYSDDEFNVMKSDVQILKQYGADGFVFGILNSDGTIDKHRCRELIELSRPQQVTFHRAFDMTCDWEQSLADIINLGFDHLLTSGHAADVMSGLDEIKNIVKKAGNRIQVMPGGGINTGNLKEILQHSGVQEFHGSARLLKNSAMTFRNISVSMGTASSEYSIKVVNSDLVSTMVNIAAEVWKK